MEKFAKKDLFTLLGRIDRHSLLLVAALFFLSGCASGQMPGYISRVDHPYDRTFYGSFEKVTSAFMYVLKKQGWTIDSEVDPAIYERDDRYDNNSYQNLLIITDVRKHFLQLSAAHLNVFIHSNGNTCSVEVRFSSGRGDRAVQDILDTVESEVNR
jgi:hypothetical protein